ncbi:MAG TPA: MFS transporter [Chloroflexota bacterium]|nr:MFS transporter [Chloroflexota bacterium]
MILSRQSVWRVPHFPLLWAGQATSLFGSWIGGLAFDLAAILTLHAGPAQMAVLNGALYLPGALLAPWSGILADRVSQRHLLAAVDLARALALLSIPVAALQHALTLTQLDIVAVLLSAGRTLFDVSFRAYVPTLLSGPALLRGNAVLEGTGAVAEAGGFALGGVLVQLLTAPLTIAADAVSFLLSTVSLLAIRSSPRAHVETAISWREIVAGWPFIRQRPVLRVLTGAAFLWDLASSMIGVVIMLFFVRDLHLHPAEMGPLFGIGGVSSFLGALVAGRVIQRLGLGRALIASQFVNNLGLLVLVLTGGPAALVLVLVGLEQTTDGGRAIYEIGVTTLLQQETSDTIRGRVFGAYETARSAAMVLGLIAGGILGPVVGLRGVLVVALALYLLVPALLALSPVSRAGASLAAPSSS